VNNYCRKCGDEGKKFYRYQCVKDCPAFSMIQDDLCIYCKEVGLFFYNNICIDNCPVGTFSDYSENFCRNQGDLMAICLNGGKFVNGTCYCTDNFIGDICQYKSNNITAIISSFGINS
jgi:hypothetical protein